MSNDEKEFDLRPDPRILPMLGEINLAEWRCLAELIDNSIDGFLASARDGVPIDEPAVAVNVPTADVASARVTVRDNGPGMTPDVLEKAVRAGWTGNSPIGNLGMFGMGFNIATARLGIVTTVWTARGDSGEWHGLRIDFDELRRQQHFRTPHLTRPKAEPGDHGTEITIERLKPERRAFLAKQASQTSIRRNLAEAYSAMLRQNGVPLTFQLSLNGRRLQPNNHCVWGEDRAVETSRWGRVPAVMTIDRRLPNRPFCVVCWQWLAADETVCPACGSSSNVAKRERHVHGWIGLQRYLSVSEFGIDFVRNGRKIEIANKDLFEWKTDTGSEREYPIDDPRSRGRFVGEIHLDHCRVSYTKDRFDRTDPAWEEMARIVRGEGPLRPDKAADAGFGPNESPLFRLYQAFRRSSPPKARTAGGWAKVLAVKNNELAEEMAKRFERGEPEYQTDQKWWALIEEEDRNLLTPGGATGTATPGTSPGSPASPALPGFSGGNTGGVRSGGAGSAPIAPPAGIPPSPPPAPLRRSIASLTREYRHDSTNLRWDVKAFEVESGDPVFDGKALPWRMVRRTTGEWEFFVNPEHSIFRSATMTQLDALLFQLCWSVLDSTRGEPNPPSPSAVLAELRDRYGGELRLDAVALKSQAESLFSAIAKSWSTYVEPEDREALFDEDLAIAEREEIYQRMATRNVNNPRDAVTKGRFLEYASAATVVRFVVAHPELFFDGRCWDDAYSELTFPVQAATDAARSRVLRYYESMLLDASWLIEQDADDIAVAPRERVLRSAMALDLLWPVS